MTRTSPTIPMNPPSIGMLVLSEQEREACLAEGARQAEGRQPLSREGRKALARLVTRYREKVIAAEKG